jgi:hypothetical protein
MAKEINTYRDLSITWVKKANRFQLDARPLGGTRMRVKTKAKASQTAKELFDKWTEGTPIVEQERWSVDKAIEKHKEVGKLRVDDKEDTYGAGFLGQQIQQLGVIQKLMILEKGGRWNGETP